MPSMDVPTNETIAFLQAHVPAPARLLEVGCGDGLLAFRLQKLGYDVVALDASAQAIERARNRGVDARLVTWPDYENEPFPVILFTHSLHHMNPLEACVQQARKLLQPTGVLLAEEFAYRNIEPAASEWLYQSLAVLDAASAIDAEAENSAVKILRKGGLQPSWFEGHDHPLHTAEAMLASFQRHFGQVEMTAVPYLYRYACGGLPDDAKGNRIAERLLALERRMAEQGRFPLIGRRFHCRP